MSSKKNLKKQNIQDLEEEENEENEIENEEEENEEINDTQQEKEEQEEQEEEFEKNNEQEENEENENEHNKKKSNQDDLEEGISNIGDASLKIHNIISILSDFKIKGEEGKSRNEYMMELKELCKSYYEYNDDICDLIFNLFPPNEAIEFMEASDSQKIITIRTNSLKTKRRELAKNLISRGVNLDPLAEWSKVGLKIYSSTVPIGATPEYLSGQYMLQSASSFLPVLSLEPHPGEKILDMCASPGGKTTYIGQLMKNEGLLVANDFKKERIKSLFFNVHRMGIKNSIITNYDGREFAKLYNKFDRVLLDAPCSGLGVISKDKSVKMNRTYKEILNNSKLQKELILAAIDSCNGKGKGDGIIVYSTCTISVEENEWVIDYALKHRYVKCIETGLEIGEPGFSQFREKHFHPSISNTRRIYPHIHNIDGFFIAKLKKYNDGPKIKRDIPKKENEKNKNKKNEKKFKNKKEKEIENHVNINNEDLDININDYENNLEENIEPEDIQEQIKKGKLKDYNSGDEKKNKNKKYKKNDDEENDDIFSGEEYEKDEEDIEKDAKKLDKKERKLNFKEKNFKKKRKNKEKEKIKEEIKEKKESNIIKEKTESDEKNEKNGNKDKEEKINEKNIKEKIEDRNENFKMKRKEEMIEEEVEGDEKDLKEKKKSKKRIQNKDLKENIKADDNKIKIKENERKKSEEKEDKLINKKRKLSDSKGNNIDKCKDKSTKKRKNK